MDILNVNNGYKKEYHIHSLFNWLKGDSLFTITYKLIKSCSLCFKYIEQKVQLYPLISITIDELNSCSNFVDILYNKLKINNSICEDCSYDKDKKIKKDNIFHNCMKIIITSIEMPYFLFFVFELSNENENDNINQFRNLMKYRDIIKSYIEPEIIFNNIEYKLYGILFMKSSNHYTAYCHICLNDELNLSKNNSYYYDCCNNNGEIILINELNFHSKIEKIIVNNPFIILYIKNN